MSAEVAVAASPAPTAVVVPDSTRITSVSADSPRVASSESLPDDAASKEEGEQGDARPPKSAEQRELETLRRRLARQDRVNARLWAENQAAQQRQPSQQQPASHAPAADEAEERLQVSRKDFEAAAEARARQLASQMTASERAEEKLAERCNGLLDNGTKLDPKFDQAIVEVGAELPLFDQRGQPTPALEEILDSAVAAKLILHLKENLDVAAELADLSPRQLTRRLIALEAEVAKPQREVSTAPRPLEVERSVARSGEPDPAKNPAAWREWRNKTSKIR